MEYFVNFLKIRCCGIFLVMLQKSTVLLNIEFTGSYSLLLFSLLGISLTYKTKKNNCYYYMILLFTEIRVDLVSSQMFPVLQLLFFLVFILILLFYSIIVNSSAPQKIKTSVLDSENPIWNISI